MTWTVVGQDQAVSALTNAAKHERVAHAYLFAGPTHVGKTLTALQFAQLLNCTDAEPPCGHCGACERIAAGRHADVEIVSIGGLCKPRPNEGPHDHAKDNSRDIRICQVRRMEDVVSRAPFEGRCRVIIIEPADAMNETTQNALLKTLEEPPDNVVLILVTDREEMLLPTIRSRVRRIAFGGMTRAAIERVLRTRWDAEPTRASELARLARGRLGWAVLAMHDEHVVEQRLALLDAAQQLASAGLAERFAVAAEMGGRYTRDRAGTQATLDAWEEIWRDIMLLAAGRENQAVHRERLDSLRPLAAQCDVPAAVRALRAIGDARGQLAENASPALALEAMMLELPVLRPNAVSERLAGR
ncbi:MAG: DNA polymerase III subunit [Dehalococcoidia bacterium]|nr:MAG: DNA polymerase III subunit [Dehalococcoidia bacterium]